MDLTIILTVGKYAVLVAIYAFVLVVFRGIIKQLASESKRGQEAPAGAGMRQRRVSRRPLPETASEPRPAPEPEDPKPQPPAEPELEPAEEPKPEPTVVAGLEAPVRRASRIDLLSEEPPEVVQAREDTVAPSDPEPEPMAAPEAPPAPPEPAAPHLLVLETGDEAHEAGETIPLSAAVTIGRAEENSLHIADRFISSRHALVCLRDGRRILVDRGSTNGTFVNGDRVEDEIELSDGDRIAMGNTVLEYHAG